MKKIIILASAFLLATGAFAQAPQKMSYQAVIRNSSNNLVASAPVGMQVSILQGSPTGTAVYVETHMLNTNANGLASMQIGGGTVVSGTFSGIDWAAGPYFIKTETDPAGGTNYTITGTTQLLSVPYALYAETSGTPGPQGPAGATGAQGPAGAVGQSAYQTWLSAGNTGTETDFLDSLVGAQGPTGPQGAQGNDGAQGIQGVQGVAGNTGAQGPAGNSAYQIWLAAGNTGTETDFLNSLTGATGAQGPQGPQGNTGATGAQGPQGNTGAQGPIGNTGAVGPQGPIGNAGATGAVGAQGAQGNAGLSAYQVWLEAGHTGTQADYLASLVGATGAQGAAGAQGPQGNTGATGPIGPQGPQGNTGAQGPQGNTGATGATGAVGPQGPVGATGEVGPQGPAGATGAVGPQGPMGPSNVVQSYSEFTSVATNSVVTIGGISFRVNSEGAVEARMVTGSWYGLVYSNYCRYTFYTSVTAPTVFVNDGFYNTTEWKALVVSAGTPAAQAKLSEAYSIVSYELSPLPYPYNTDPIKSFRIYSMRDGYNRVVLRVEYFYFP